MAAPNHYEVLGLPPTASQDEVAQRFEELSRLYGPDGAQTSMMKLIEEAHRVLSNAALRSVYDSGLTDQANGSSPPVADIPPVSDVTAGIVPAVIRNAQAASPERFSLDITTEIPKPDLERTTVVDIPSLRPDVRPAESVPNDKVLASELTKRGVSAGEVDRLLAIGRSESTATKKKGRPVISAPVIPPSHAYVPKPTITLPPFRVSSPDERQRAERMLTNANISRRRGQFAEAEKECRAALDLVPQDSAALELYGDILQSVGRVDDALYTYQRATEADETRRTAERKYAELMLLQNREVELLRSESIPRNASLAVLLSAVFPGTGQMYNGDTLKGLFIFVIMASCIYLLGWTPFGFHKGLRGVTAPLAFFSAIAAITYGFAVIDANISARRGKIRSGWDV